MNTADDPATLDLVEQLDDAVFDLIAEGSKAVEEVSSIWEQLSKRVSPQALAATREQYLRYVLTLCDVPLENGLRDPARAARALEMIELLFGPD